MFVMNPSERAPIIVKVLENEASTNLSIKTEWKGDIFTRYSTESVSVYHMEKR